MPKDTSTRHALSDKDRYQAYKHPSRHGKGRDDISPEDVPETSAAKGDWENATCPICMEFPHNAVLLFCSSHDRGCRPYMCNTSYRHSNCLDQYQKAGRGCQRNQASSETSPRSGHRMGRLPNTRSLGSVRTRRRSGISLVLEAAAVENVGTELEIVEPGSMESCDRADEPDQLHEASSSLQGDVTGLLCPLCRGKVEGWKVIEPAREHMNAKVRSCSQEACQFSGNYEELRVHARREHPLARPSEIDPVRQRDWRRLERRRDLGDVMSTMLAGATVVGDAMIEDDLGEEEEAMDFPGDDGHWWTVFLLFQVFGPSSAAVNEGSPRRHSRTRVARRSSWGESLTRRENRQVDDGSSEDNDAAEMLRRSTRRRRRRAESN